MENVNQPQDHLVDFEKPEIYSRNAVRGFSIFFSTIFGGVLLMQNLNSLGRRKDGTIAFVISIAIAIAAGIIGNLISSQGSSLGILMSVVAAGAYSELVYKKYIPNEADYGKKKIWKPLIIGLVIFVPLTVWVIYAVLHSQQ